MHFCPECRRVYQHPVEYCSADGTATAMVDGVHDPLVGLVFDERYELVRQIGAGGNGLVYLARQVGLERFVALKMMYAERMQEPRSLKRFAREARALAALDHPGCVRVLDFRAPEDSVPYLVMELVEGHPLGDVIGADGVPPQHAVLTALRIAEAVDAAHRAGIVHRDLKPENVILDVRENELRVRLIDFGLAIVVESAEEDRLTRQGRVVGTPEYMSPEQVRGGDADGRSDLYALGVLLYELVEGSPPFHAATPSATAAMHIEDVPPPLSDRGLPPAVHAKLAALVMQLLEKAPEDRPSTGEEVARRLGALLTELPDAGPATALLDGADPWQVDSEVRALGSTTESNDIPRGLNENTATKDAPKTKRWRVPAAIGAGVLVVGLAVLVPWMLMHGGDENVAATAPAPSAEAPAEPPEGRLELEPIATPEQTPTTGLRRAGTIELPGGAAQEDYESALRALSASLSAEGLRPRDVRSNPRGARAWAAQSQAARARSYATAVERLGEVRAVANSRTAHEWMVYRLQAVERRLGSPPPRALAPRLRALWATLEASSTSPMGVRRFMSRIDQLEREAR